jgi:xylan 1,4-beta-xylosidase
LVRAVLATIGLSESLSYWTFTDVFEEAGAGPAPLHGGFGLYTMQGLPKPTAHAYRMLGALGDEELVRTEFGVVTRDSQTGLVQAVLTHYPPEVTSTVPPSYEDDGAAAWQTRLVGRPATARLRIEGLEAGARFEIEVLDRDHGDLVAAWRAPGAPRQWSRELTRQLDQRARATHLSQVVADAAGVLTLERQVQPWTVLMARQLPGSSPG